MRTYSRKIDDNGLLGDIAGSVVDKIIKELAGTIVNKCVDLLPFELHLPHYQYCGTGTKLSQR